MKRIAIVNNGQLPLPSVRGGAVESLIQLLVDYNEIYHLFYFEIYSVYDELAFTKAKDFHYSSFHYIKKNKKYIIKELLCRIYNAFSKRLKGDYLPPVLFSFMVKDLRANRLTRPVDAILTEGAPRYAHYLKQKTSLPIIQRIHNLPMHINRIWDIKNAKATDMYIGISKYVCDVLAQFEGSYCSRIEVLHNSTDIRLFNYELTNGEIKRLREQYGIKPDDFVIIFTGRLQEYKGVRELIIAFNKCKDLPNVKLLVVGGGFFSSTQKNEFEMSLVSLVSDNKENIIFTGYVEYSQIYRYYKISNLAILPSTWEEPFALTCLEALLCGTPVVITQSGGMPEIVDYKCAVIVEKDDQLINSLEKEIRRLYSNPALLESMSIHARERAKVFNPDNHYLRFSDMVNTLLKNSTSN